MIAPVLARRLVYPLHERLLKRPTFAYLDELEQSQRLSREALEALERALYEGPPAAVVDSVESIAGDARTPLHEFQMERW